MFASPKILSGRLIFLFLGLLGSASALALESVTLQLKWKHTFQFAGYYAALAQGYYSDAGLQVNLVAAQPGTEVLQNVLNGHAQYGVGTSSLLLARQAGKPVVALAVIFQHSPLALVARQTHPLQGVHDLAGSRVMLEADSDELRAYLKQEGINIAQIQLAAHSFSTRDLIEARVDAMSVYTTNEIYELQQSQLPYQVYSARSVGIDFYGDNLFTTEAEIAAHPARVAAFRSASLKGWQYAMAHPEEIANLIYTRYSQAHPREFYLFEASQMVPLMRTDLIEVGYMNPGRWQHIAQTYAALGLLGPDISLEGFLYQLETPARIFNPYLLAALALLLLAAGVAAYIFRINQRLSRNLAQLHEAQDSQMQSEALFRTLSDTAAAGIYVLHGSRFSMANASMSALTGYSLEELLQMEFADFIHPDDLTMVNRRAVMHPPHEKMVSRYQFRILTKNGGMRWVELTSGRMMINGQLSVVGTVYDISEHRQLESALQQSHALYQSILAASPDAMVVTDLQGVIEHISPAGVSMLRAGHESDLLGRNIDEFRDPEEEARAVANIAGMFEGRYLGAEEYRVIRLDGSVLDTEINAEIIRDADEQPSGLIFVVRDISERKKTEQRIRHMAQHDALTGLANRALFADRMQRALANARRDQTPLALMFLDLDKFKPINDTYGHAVGDLLLQQVAQCIEACVRESDTVARIGGDEFVVLLRCIRNTNDVLGVAEKIRNSLCQPFELAGHSLEISSSIGVAMYPEHGTDDLTLSKNADHAMYLAKEAGRNRVYLFAPEPVAGP